VLAGAVGESEAFSPTVAGEETVHKLASKMNGHKVEEVFTANDYAEFLHTCFDKSARDLSSEFVEWCFFVTLCRALQDGENQLTAADAMWLGLIDTIRTDIEFSESA
jgi:hypothetical protein